MHTQSKLEMGTDLKSIPAWNEPLQPGEGTPIKLSEYIGVKPVVLFFFPKVRLPVLLSHALLALVWLLAGLCRPTPQGAPRRCALSGTSSPGESRVPSPRAPVSGAPRCGVRTPPAESVQGSRDLSGQRTGEQPARS